MNKHLRDVESLTETLQREIEGQVIEPQLATSVLCLCNILHNLIGDLDGRSNPKAD